MYIPMCRNDREMRTYGADDYLIIRLSMINDQLTNFFPSMIDRMEQAVSEKVDILKTEHRFEFSILYMMSV